MHRQGGFTMIELMMVVAVLSILTVVAVVAYNRVFRKARSAEVPEVFAELKVREEAYHAEKGTYLGLCTTPLATECQEGDGNWWPSPLGTGDVMDATAPPLRFQQLHVHIDKAGLYCQYEAIAGLASDGSNMGATGTVLFTAAPPRNWYYLMAQCDWDGDSSVNALYWMRDDLSTLGQSNELR